MIPTRPKDVNRQRRFRRITLSACTVPKSGSAHNTAHTKKYLFFACYRQLQIRMSCKRHPLFPQTAIIFADFGYRRSVGGYVREKALAESLKKRTAQKTARCEALLRQSSVFTCCGTEMQCKSLRCIRKHAPATRYGSMLSYIKR